MKYRVIHYETQKVYLDVQKKNPIFKKQITTFPNTGFGGTQPKRFDSVK